MTMLPLTPGLVVHIAGGGLGILSGTAALMVRKGDTLHRRFGTVFVIAMLTMAGMGATLAVYNMERANIVVGILTMYFVLTAWLTVHRPANSVGGLERTALIVPIGCALMMWTFGFMAMQGPHGLDGNAPPLYFVFAVFASLLTVADIRYVRRGGLAGTPRLVRHLWRMCAALFLATGSFFLGQQKVMPQAWHGARILVTLALAPLALMLFWLIRVRFRFNPAPEPAE